MPIDTTCPECGAPHAKKLSLIYTEGKSTVQLTSHSTGTMKTIGKQKIVSAGTSSGVQQTDISRLAAPPPDVGPFIPPSPASAELVAMVAIGGFVVFLIFVIFTPAKFTHVAAFWLVTTAAAAIYRAVSMNTESEAASVRAAQAEYEKRVAPQRKAIEDWGKTFQCLSCGHRFIPIE